MNKGRLLIWYAIAPFGIMAVQDCRYVAAFLTKLCRNASRKNEISMFDSFPRSSVGTPEGTLPRPVPQETASYEAVFGNGFLRKKGRIRTGASGAIDLTPERPRYAFPRRSVGTSSPHPAFSLILLWRNVHVTATRALDSEEVAWQCQRARHDRIRLEINKSRLLALKLLIYPEEIRIGPNDHFLQYRRTL